jgi:hypothetical protein
MTRTVPPPTQSHSSLKGTNLEYDLMVNSNSYPGFQAVGVAYMKWAGVPTQRVPQSFGNRHQLRQDSSVKAPEKKSYAFGSWKKRI